MLNATYSGGFVVALIFYQIFGVWGKLLDSAVQYYTIQPWLILWPGLALLIVTLSFNLLGDGLRDAFDPRAHL